MPKGKGKLASIIATFVAIALICAGIFAYTSYKNPQVVYGGSVIDSIKLDVYSEITPEIETLIVGKHFEGLTDVYYKLVIDNLEANKVSVTPEQRESIKDQIRTNLSSFYQENYIEAYEATTITDIERAVIANEVAAAVQISLPDETVQQQSKLETYARIQTVDDEVDQVRVALAATNQLAMNAFTLIQNAGVEGTSSGMSQDDYDKLMEGFETLILAGTTTSQENPGSTVYDSSRTSDYNDDGYDGGSGEYGGGNGGSTVVTEQYDDSAIQSSLLSLSDITGSLTVTQETLTTDVQDLLGKISVLEQSVSNMDTSDTQITAAVSQLQTELATANQALADVQTTMQDAIESKQSESVASAAATTETAVNEAKAEAAANLEQAKEDTESKIAEINSKIEALDTSSSSSLEAKTNQLEESLENTRAVLDALISESSENAATELSDAREALTTALDETNTALTNVITANRDESNEKFEQAEQALATAQANLETALNTAQTNLETALNTTQTNLENTITQTDNRLTTNITNLNAALVSANNALVETDNAIQASIAEFREEEASHVTNLTTSLEQYAETAATATAAAQQAAQDYADERKAESISHTETVSGNLISKMDTYAAAVDSHQKVDIIGTIVVATGDWQAQGGHYKFSVASELFSDANSIQVNYSNQYEINPSYDISGDTLTISVDEVPATSITISNIIVYRLIDEM